MSLLASNVFSTAYLQSDPVGKVIILSLVLLSFICWITLAYKLWMVYQVSKISKRFKQIIEANHAALLTIDPALLPNANQKITPHPFLAIFLTVRKKTVEILNKNQFFLSQLEPAKNPYLTSTDLTLLESSGMVTISASNSQLEAYLFILPTIVTLAPFLGLLGTVWGILETFTGLQTGGQMGSSSAILGGISTALATTVLGLVIAIPALIGSNYIKNYLKHYLSQMDDFLTSLILYIEIQYRKVE